MLVFKKLCVLNLWNFLEMLKNNLLFKIYKLCGLFIWIWIYGERFSNLYLYKLIHIQTKMNAYKDFHAFACISMIKTCVTDLALKNKNVNSQVAISIKAD